MFISKVDLPVSSQYRSEKDGENNGIIVENKHMNGLEILVWEIIITSKHRFLVFNIIQLLTFVEVVMKCY